MLSLNCCEYAAVKIHLAIVVSDSVKHVFIINSINHIRYISIINIMSLRTIEAQIS